MKTFLSLIQSALVAGSFAGSVQAHAETSTQVLGIGAARAEEVAKSRARTDAQRQCLDKIGDAGVIQASKFSIVKVRPADTGLFYIEASAFFECTAAIVGE